MRTPEFVRWTIAHACPLREMSDWRSPEQTERLLRPLRACSLAIAEGRVREGIAVLDGDENATLAFRVDECLAAFGNSMEIDRLCATCPANASLAGERPAWAGCYGELPRESAGRDLAQAIEKAIDSTGTLFPETQPAWYGLWMNGEPSRPQRVFLESVFSSTGGEDYPGAADFLAALRTSLASDLSLMLSLAPAGELQGDAWIVAAHCPACRAERMPKRGACPACGQVNHPLPARNRKRRGMRPYRPLAGILGERAARDHVSREG